jgi:hypothetical protein
VEVEVQKAVILLLLGLDMQAVMEQVEVLVIVVPQV